LAYCNRIRDTFGFNKGADRVSFDIQMSDLNLSQFPTAATGNVNYYVDYNEWTFYVGVDTRENQV
jgi:hypothetical protein